MRGFSFSLPLPTFSSHGLCRFTYLTFFMSVVSAAETSLQKAWHGAMGTVVARSVFNLHLGAIQSRKTGGWHLCKQYVRCHYLMP